MSRSSILPICIWSSGATEKFAGISPLLRTPFCLTNRRMLLICSRRIWGGGMTISIGDGYARAYSHRLRTGKWLRPYASDGRELKFNPYHDPRNGQFTFAPGGPRSLSRILVADRTGTRT